MNRKQRDLALLMCPAPWYRVLEKSEVLPDRAWVVAFEHPSEGRCVAWAKRRYREGVIGKHVFIEPIDPATGGPFAATQGEGGK